MNMPINQFDTQGWTSESALWRKRQSGEKSNILLSRND
ncbi:hypothetical protein CSC12_6457 (plasmid) [Klebsiella michiganensis]|nr:hypothetical protein CSC12_6457 [Klebsiella michiganensis]